MTDGVWPWKGHIKSLGQGSSQGILECRAGMRVPPAGTHETKKNIYIWKSLYVQDADNADNGQMKLTRSENQIKLMK
jgi:hypothetical protein